MVRFQDATGEASHLRPELRERRAERVSIAVGQPGQQLRELPALLSIHGSAAGAITVVAVVAVVTAVVAVVAAVVASGAGGPGHGRDTEDEGQQTDDFPVLQHDFLVVSWPEGLRRE